MATKTQLRTFPDLEPLSRAAAELFLNRAVESAQRGKFFSAAFSGGKTPQTFLRILASREFSERISWDQTRLFQVDERCVPPDHPDSNYRMIRDALLEPVQGAAVHFYRMKADQQDLDAASQEYARQLEEILTPPSGTPPRLDLILLGMGPDGHTASLFPGSAALRERSKWVCSNYVEKLRAQRLTLTYPVLNAASELVFMVVGSDKAEALRQVLEGPINPELYPAQGVNPADGAVTWLVDQAAAGLLRAARRTAP
jgi:6-phosphogluconolactonase